MDQSQAVRAVNSAVGKLSHWGCVGVWVTSFCSSGLEHLQLPRIPLDVNVDNVHFSRAFSTFAFSSPSVFFLLQSQEASQKPASCLSHNIIAVYVTS